MAETYPRIMIVARWPVGGIRTYLRYIYCHEMMKNYEFHLLTPPAEGISYCLDYFSSSSIEHTIVNEGGQAFMLGTAKLMAKWRPQLLHSHGFTSATLLAPLARIRGIPHLATNHDILFDRQFLGISGRIRRFGVGMALNMASHVMAVGEDALDNLRRFYPSLATLRRSSAVRNGIDVEAFSGYEQRQLRDELRLSNSTVLLGFFGRFMAQKGFNLLMDAVEQIQSGGRDVQVACFGWGGFVREEQATLIQRGLLQYFHFLPHTDDMLAALRGVDIVVIPSRWEACPLLPMEALVAGAPLVTSDCIGMREVIRDTPALPFPAGNADALGRCLLSAIDQLPVLADQATAFRAEAARRFDSRDSAKGLKLLYDKYLDRRI